MRSVRGSMRQAMNAASLSPALEPIDLRQFAETAPVILWATDSDGACVFLSPGWHESTGQTEEEALGIGWTNAVHPDEREEIRRAFRSANQKRSPFHVECRLQQKNGEYRWALDAGNPRFAEDGEFLGFAGCVIDIHDRKLARTALQASEDRYKSLLELMPAGLYTVEAATGTITYFNEHAARIWGRTPRLNDTEERFCGSFKVFMPDGTFVPREQTPMAFAVREGRSFRNTEAIVERPDGTRVTALVNIDPLRDAQGRIVGAVNVFHDITDRRLAEQALAQSEHRYRAVVESQSEMICRFRPDGVILFVNAAYARSRGRTVEELSGENFWQFIPLEDHESVRAMLARLTPREPEARVENRFETTAGTRWTLWTNRALAFDADGRSSELQSTGVDITDIKRLEQALLEADRRKDEFLAILSHELRNPLAPIRNFVSLLKTRGGVPGVLDEALPVLDRQVGHLVRLVDDLLDVARINRGDIVLQKRPVALEEIVTAAIETSQPLVESRGHELTVDLCCGDVNVHGDPVRLAQVLANVLNNAASYTPSNGRIEVSARLEDGNAVLRVADNGPGFSPETARHMFELFVRGNDLRNHPAGFGIGLALARRLVEMHGGRIDAFSDGEGRGSEFVVRLPVETTLHVVSQELPRENGGGSRNVLVVDDNVDAAESLAMLLNALGNNVTVACDGVRALEAFRTAKFDVVLLDIGMPGMDGYEVAREIRSRHPGSAVTLVAVTGWGQDEDRRRAMDAGFDHHLVKPAEIEAIEAILARC